MDGAAFPAAISGAEAIAVAALTAGSTYLLTKRREREAEWRQMKLDLYKEYIAALSGAVSGRETSEPNIRYADAVNVVTLVAPASVLKELYAFNDEITSQTRSANETQQSALLTELLNALRHDIDPRRRFGNENLLLRLHKAPQIRAPRPHEVETRA